MQSLHPGIRNICTRWRIKKMPPVFRSVTTCIRSAGETVNCPFFFIKEVWFLPGSSVQYRQLCSVNRYSGQDSEAGAGRVYPCLWRYTYLWKPYRASKRTAKREPRPFPKVTIKGRLNSIEALRRIKLCWRVIILILQSRRSWRLRADILKRKRMKENRVSIIVAMDEKRGIGKDGNLLFKISEDFRRMNSLTAAIRSWWGEEHFFQSKSPWERQNNDCSDQRSAKSQDINFYSPEVKIVPSLTEGINEAKQSPGSDEIFIFGGGEIFKEASEKNLVDKLYLTKVEGDFQADTFFPDYSEFKKVVFEKSGQEGSINTNS